MTTDELVRDLALALQEPESQHDLEGVLAAWGEIATGQCDPDTERWAAVPTPLDPREALALTLAEKGPLTSADLARASSYSQEACRLTLATLVERGALVRVGNHKSARYCLPPRATV